MKIILIVIAFFFLIPCNSFSQFYADSVVSDYVIEFMEIADEFSKSFDQVQGVYNMEFTDEEVEHIAELFFKAFNEDPVGFSYYIMKEFYKWGAKVKESGKVTEPKPAMKRNLLEKQITKKYGITFTEVIGTPAFLRGKFITSTRSTYYSPDIKSNFPQMNFIFLIEDILKGDKFFIVGDTVTISTIPNVESPAPKFETDKSYLIPVRPRIGLTEYKGEVTFNYLHEYYDRWVMGKPPKTFLIENEIIKNCEYFRIKETSWTDYKKFFKETFLIFN
jgi:hypothetical protein